MRSRVVHVRVGEGGLEAFDKACAERGVRRSVALREAMLAWLGSAPSRRVVAADSPPLSALSKADDTELRQWRAFADRTAINGDPERQVSPDIDMHGWTFVVLPQRDENLEIA